MTRETRAQPPVEPSFRELLPVFLLSLVSGAISLGYQVMWFRIFAQRFGSTNLTFLLVLVAFIGGLGLGALLSRPISTLLGRSRTLADPLALVGLLEVAIALSALLTLLFGAPPGAGPEAFPYLRDARGIFVPTLGMKLEVGVGVLAMLLPTFLMGTTFPILSHAFRSRSVFPSELYAWNTLGACSGVLLAEFLLLPTLGHTRAFPVLVGLNVALGILFFLLSRSGLARAGEAAAALEGDPGHRPDRARASRKEWEAPASAPGQPRFRPAVLLAAAALSGLLAGSLEVDMFRAVRFAGAITDAAMSFTSFWAILAIFLASSAVRALGRPRPLLVRMAVPVALVAHAFTWMFLPEIRGFFNDIFMGWTEGRIQADPALTFTEEVYPLSGSLPLLLGFTGVVVFPAYFLISLLLPTVCNMVQEGREHLGLAYGLNTLAFCLGAVLFNWVFPGVSLFYAVKLLFVLLSAGAVLALALRPGRPVPRLTLGISLAAVVAGVVLVPRGFDARFFPDFEAPARYPVRGMRSNAAHTTYVVEAPQGDILFFDSHPMSGTGLKAQRYMGLMAHMPLLAHPDPRRVLLICFGVGNTARAIAAHGQIEVIDVVDLNDRVFETAPEFARTNHRVYRDLRVRLIHDDGRRFLDRTRGLYDLVTSEPPPPRAEGVYRLYSVEYYRSVLAHLTPAGMMTQWLPVNVLSREAIDRIVASFVEVFPHTLLFVGSEDQLILLGGRQPLDPALLERRFRESPGAYLDLSPLGITEPVSLLARILRTDAELRRDVEHAPLISDERNDLALAVTDPFDPPSLRFDPLVVLAYLQPHLLESGPRLTEVLTDLRRIREVVPDFPGG